MSGPVRKSDEILPADANGAGRTPAGRPAVFIQCKYCGVKTVPPIPCCIECYQGMPQYLRELVLSDYPVRTHPRPLELPEQSREHIRNALEMLINGGDDKYLIGNERRVVYDAGVIDAVKTRLNKALGL